VLDHLGTRETAFVLASRAPYDKIAAVARERDWFVPWYSTYGSDFNYDYQVTLDADRGQLQYNYRAEPDAAAVHTPAGFRIRPHWFLKILPHGIANTCVGY
jgi:predicted dithiol-disulfide oxidoreductase (DUF899 family)